jgi:hypothetical protein
MQTVAVATDLVEITDDGLVIHARHPIPDWSIREFCRQPIFFAGQKYYLRSRQDGRAPFAVIYDLAPWPADVFEESGAKFVYDEEFVLQRDAEFGTERTRTIIWYLLLPLYPVLGLCWSRFKERVLWPLGFVPSAITSASIMLMFCVVFCDAILFGFLGGGLVIRLVGFGALGDWAFVMDLLLIALLAFDCAVRFSQLLRDDSQVPYGLLEWLVPARFLRR